MKLTIITFLITIAAVLVYAYGSKSNEEQQKSVTVTDKIKLPPPETTGGMPLMEALSKRHSDREFSSNQLDEKTLSTLLWAAVGINRSESGKRTAPTANNSLSMEVYVIMEAGAYRYSAEEHALELVTNKDIRELAGNQDFVKTAPLNLVYVSDYSRMKEGSNKEMYSGAHAGFISQNVYLYCASAGLSTVVRAWVEREPLSKALNLNDNLHVVLAQTVGYPLK